MRRAWATAVLALFLSFPGPGARAAGEPAAPPPPEPADVTVGTRVVTTFRVEVFGKPPALRARDATRSLEELVREGTWGEVHVRTDPIGRLFFVGSRMVFGLAPGDVATARGETLDAASEATARRLSQALAEVREGRSGKDLLVAIFASVVATALFLLVAGALRRLRQLLEGRLVALTRRLVASVEAKGGGFLPLLWTTRAATWAVRIAIGLADLFAGPDALLSARGAEKEGSLLADLAAVRDETLEALAGLAPRLAGVEAGLGKPLESTRENVRFSFEKLIERTRAAAGRANEAEARQLRRLAASLAPGGRPAERVYSPLPWLLRHGRAGLVGPLKQQLRWDVAGLQEIAL